MNPLMFSERNEELHQELKKVLRFSEEKDISHDPIKQWEDILLYTVSVRSQNDFKDFYFSGGDAAMIYFGANLYSKSQIIISKNRSYGDKKYQQVLFNLAERETKELSEWKINQNLLKIINDFREKKDLFKL